MVAVFKTVGLSLKRFDGDILVVREDITPQSRDILKTFVR